MSIKFLDKRAIHFLHTLFLPSSQICTLFLSSLMRVQGKCVIFMEIRHRHSSALIYLIHIHERFNIIINLSAHQASVSVFFKAGLEHYCQDKREGISNPKILLKTIFWKKEKAGGKILRLKNFVRPSPLSHSSLSAGISSLLSAPESYTSDKIRVSPLMLPAVHLLLLQPWPTGRNPTVWLYPCLVGWGGGGGGGSWKRALWNYETERWTLTFWHLCQLYRHVSPSSTGVKWSHGFACEDFFKQLVCVSQVKH